MALRPDIILAGAQPDILGAMSRGNELAAQTNTLRDQNALRQVYQTQGAGLLQGNRQSLNALAGIDPFAAANMQGAVLQNRTAQRQFEIMNAEEKRAIAQAAAQMDAAEKAAAAEATRRQVQQFVAAPSPEVWDQLVTQAGKPELRGQWANRQVIAAEYVSSVEEALALSQAPAGPEWRNATPEEAQAFGAMAGQINTKTGKFEAINPPRGTSFEVLPGGGVRFNDGPGVQQTEGFQPSDPMLMIDSINGILNDPALPYATGWLAWTQNIPGTVSKRFGARADQLNGQAFLQAFESLKGAGQITEIEGLKATQAIGRLDTAQRPEDYAQALKELRELLMLGASRVADAPRRLRYNPETGALE